MDLLPAESNSAPCSWWLYLVAFPGGDLQRAAVISAPGMGRASTGSAVTRVAARCSRTVPCAGQVGDRWVLRGHPSMAWQYPLSSWGSVKLQGHSHAWLAPGQSWPISATFHVLKSSSKNRTAAPAPGTLLACPHSNGRASL